VVYVVFVMNFIKYLATLDIPYKIVNNINIENVLVSPQSMFIHLDAYMFFRHLLRYEWILYPSLFIFMWRS
ncbi:hypothetical protein EAF47_24845, partial [Escherichia coli]|nr:hypothetical protein [Escherichia coli]